MIHPQHLLPLQSLVSTLLHHGRRVTSSVQVGEQLAVNEAFGVVNHQVHDDLGDEIPACLGDNLHVGVDEVPDGLDLPLQLGVHGHRAVTAAFLASRVRGGGQEEGKLVNEINTRSLLSHWEEVSLL